MPAGDRASRPGAPTRLGAPTALLALVPALLLSSRSSGEELLVAAAVSLQEPLARIARDFEEHRPGASVRLTTGASSVMAAQVAAGAPIDVLVSADVQILDDLADRGLIDRESRRLVARNTLVVVCAADLPVPVEAPDDLLRPAVRRVAVPGPEVPVGRYAREWLRARGLLHRILPRIVPTEHARATLAAVDAGNAEAGIVYLTDARLARSARVGFAIPAAEQPDIAYGAARATGSRHEALAAAFLDSLGGREARDALLGAGFAAP